MSAEHPAESGVGHPAEASTEHPAGPSAGQQAEDAERLSLDELETEVLRADALVQELSQRLKQTSDDRS